MEKALALEILELVSSANEKLSEAAALVRERLPADQQSKYIRAIGDALASTVVDIMHRIFDECPDARREFKNGLFMDGSERSEGE